MVSTSWPDDRLILGWKKVSASKHASISNELSLHRLQACAVSFAAAQALDMQDAMPRPGLPLVHFNDTCCGSAAELRSIILKARHLADDHAEQDRAAAAAKAWLLARIGKKRRTRSTDIVDAAPNNPFIPERLAA